MVFLTFREPVASTQFLLFHRVMIVSGLSRRTRHIAWAPNNTQTQNASNENLKRYFRTPNPRSVKFNPLRTVRPTPSKSRRLRKIRLARCCRICSIKAGWIRFDWEEILGKKGVRWLHTGGIFCALSETTPDVAIEAMQVARKHGVVISYDLNYRDSLWRSIGGKKKAQEVNRRIAPYVDVMLSYLVDTSRHDTTR